MPALIKIGPQAEIIIGDLAVCLNWTMVKFIKWFFSKWRDQGIETPGQLAILKIKPHLIWTVLFIIKRRVRAGSDLINLLQNAVGLQHILFLARLVLLVVILTVALITRGAKYISQTLRHHISWRNNLPKIHYCMARLKCNYIYLVGWCQSTYMPAI